MKRHLLKRLKFFILNNAAMGLRFLRADLLSGAERISKVVLVLMICYLLFFVASLVQYLTP